MAKFTLWDRKAHGPQPGVPPIELQMGEVQSVRPIQVRLKKGGFKQVCHVTLNDGTVLCVNATEHEINRDLDRRPDYPEHRFESVADRQDDIREAAREPDTDDQEGPGDAPVPVAPRED